ncbi:MAG: DUF2378 family protein [Acidobacteriota bacterium]
MRIKGNVLIARRAFVEKHFGAEGWRKVMEALPPHDREAFGEGITAMLWYPFALGRNLDDAIVRVLGRGNESVFEEIGAESARANLTGVHKDFLTPGDPQAFMANMPTVYRFYYDTGRRAHEATGPTSCVLTTYDADSFSAVDCLTVVGWLKEGLRMCGASNPAVVEETCRARGGDCCRYRVRWSSS